MITDYAGMADDGSGAPAPAGTVCTGPTPGSRFRRFFIGAGLPVFVLTAVAIYELFLATIVLSPPAAGAWSDFATEFKVWCFDYDPRTGGMEWAAVVVMLIEPLFIAGICAFLWRKTLGPLRSPRALAGQAAAVAGGAVVALAVIASLVAYGSPDGEQPVPPFPGQRIRTTLTPPEFRFVDQKGRSFGLEDVQGSVVLVTGVYALCSTSCPEILLETRRLLDALPAPLRDRVVVAALSLNPEYDTREIMERIADAYGLPYPQFRYLNDDPSRMNDVLTRFGFARSRDPDTGVVDHANLFVLVDAGGRIAYRLTLQPRHQAWLREAVHQLAIEAEATGSGIRLQ